VSKFEKMSNKIAKEHRFGIKKAPLCNKLTWWFQTSELALELHLHRFLKTDRCPLLPDLQPIFNFLSE
jgi:hypothetical protein